MKKLLSNQIVEENKEKEDKRYVFVALNKKLFNYVQQRIDAKHQFFGSKATLIQFLMNLYLEDSKLSVKAEIILKDLEQTITLIHENKMDVAAGINKIMEIINSLFLRI